MIKTKKIDLPNKIKYYQKKLFLAQVDNNNQLIGQIERWQAHKNKILHRGFTVILFWQNNLILQCRKHPIFDGYYDLSFSSHPIFINQKLQSDNQAIIQNLKREWLIKDDDLKSPIFVDRFLYQARDKKTGFWEYEINFLYLIKLKNQPQINPDFAYEAKIININDFINQRFDQKKIILTPWVEKINLNQLKSLLT